MFQLTHKVVLMTQRKINRGGAEYAEDGAEKKENTGCPGFGSLPRGLWTPLRALRAWRELRFVVSFPKSWLCAERGQPHQKDLQPMKHIILLDSGLQPSPAKGKK